MASRTVYGRPSQRDDRAKTSASRVDLVQAVARRGEPHALAGSGGCGLGSECGLQLAGAHQGEHCFRVGAGHEAPGFQERGVVLLGVEAADAEHQRGTRGHPDLGAEAAAGCGRGGHVDAVGHHHRAPRRQQAEPGAARGVGPAHGDEPGRARPQRPLHGQQGSPPCAAACPVHVDAVDVVDQTPPRAGVGHAGEGCGPGAVRVDHVPGLRGHGRAEVAQTARPRSRRRWGPRTDARPVSGRARTGRRRAGRRGRGPGVPANASSRSATCRLAAAGGARGGGHQEHPQAPAPPLARSHRGHTLRTSTPRGQASGTTAR